MAPPPDPIASLRVALRGHYEIEREIGQGAFATVYLARDLKHERKVAVKVLHADTSSETGELRFIREIRLLARLQHPNILPLHDSGHVETLLYYVMPYVAGETLRSRIDRTRRMDIDDACSITRDVADALAYAHGQGVIHRDIKPENILLSEGHPVLADFGIARIIDLTGVRQLTRTSMGSPGTPAYMSPEQLLGDHAIDGRSDTYSLGCVLYEMLVGKPPFVGKDGFVKRFTEPAPLPSAMRHDVPAWLDEIVAKLLARDPNLRYPNASEIVRALQSGGSSRSGEQPRPAKDASEMTFPGSDETGALVPLPGFDRPFTWLPRSRRRNALAGVGILAFAALVAAALITKGGEWRRVFVSGAPADSTRFVILPALGRDADHQRLGAQASDALYEAFRSWNGIVLVPDFEVDEALRDKAHRPTTLNEAVAVARRLGAGRLVWGHVTGDGASARVRAELYDLSSPSRPARDILLDPMGGDGVFASAARTLLSVPNRPAAAEEGEHGTFSFDALRAYDRGHVALAKWDLTNAEREFRSAIDLDNDFAAAKLWLAQVLAWAYPNRVSEWKTLAAKAVSARSSLSPREQLLTIALAAMGERRYAQACGQYRQLTWRDSLDFVGWYNLGECQALDNAVLPDAASQSKWRFRSSFNGAAAAYARAFQVDPGPLSLAKFRRLQAVLPTAFATVRFGVTSGAATFAAYPSLRGDTLAFVPYPTSEFAALPVTAMATVGSALNHDVEVLEDFVRAWIKSSPESADAQEALADILETRGEVFERAGISASAIAAVHDAQRLATDPHQHLRLTAREARLRFKASNFSGARILADSVLMNVRPGASVDAEEAIGLAALTGQIRQTAQLARLTLIPQIGVDVPPGLAETSADFFTYAALGVCGSTLETLDQRLQRDLQRYVAEDQWSSFRAAVTWRALSMSAPCDGAKGTLRITSTRDRLHTLQQAFARGDFPAVRKGFVEIANSRRSMRPGDLTLDYTFQEAWLRAAIGDTLAAVRQLDLALGALPTMSAVALREPGTAAAAGRAMALRADLAARTGDKATAKSWAEAVLALWREADPPLHPVLTRMRELTARSR